MSKSTRQQKKRDQELKRRYGKLAESMTSYYHHLDLRPLDELEDDGFAFIMANVKGAVMLDLNETNITNESIRLLTTLEYVNELRIKSCRGINNECISDLAQIKDLRFVHARYTGITIDGLLKLPSLPGITEIMFSADDEEVPEEKIEQLKSLLPNADITVNGKSR